MLEVNFYFIIRVSAHVLALLAAENIQPAGLFLEAPFTNIVDEIMEHPFAQVLKYLFFNEEVALFISNIIFIFIFLYSYSSIYHGSIG